MGILACRTYAIICFVYGVFGIRVGALMLYWKATGPPPVIATDLPTTLSLPDVVRLSSWTGVIRMLIIGTIFFALGKFAYSSRIWAMIAGCVFWMFFIGCSRVDTFKLINGVVFLLLTIVAAIAAHRSPFRPS